MKELKRHNYTLDEVDEICEEIYHKVTNSRLEGRIDWSQDYGKLCFKIDLHEDVCDEDYPDWGKDRYLATVCITLGRIVSYLCSKKFANVHLEWDGDWGWWIRAEYNWLSPEGIVYDPDGHEVIEKSKVKLFWG